MHRIDADGYIEISGKRYFQDQDDGPPPIAGTIDHSLWNNAMQEEIAQFLEALGVTLAVDGAADEAAGWSQLKDTLTVDGGINCAVLRGVINIGAEDDGGFWQQSKSFLSYSLQLVETPLKLESLSMNSTQLISRVIDNAVETSSVYVHSQGYVDVNLNGAHTILYGTGVKYSNGPGTSIVQSAHVRKSSFAITGASWSAVGSDGIYTNTVDQDLGLPTLSVDQIFSAFINYSSFGIIYCIPAAITFNIASGDIQDITVVSWDGNSPPTSYNLILEWNAIDLTV